jgi:dTDP-4-amino-4,6-dideoxygalactose transaminase
MNVPFFDLTRARDAIQQELWSRWHQIVDTTAFVQGPEVKSFESAFAEYVQAPGCVAVANGTDALVLALRALEVKAGDEVLVPAFTFFATYESVVLAGAIPVLVDIEPDTFAIDLAAAMSRLSSRTVGVVAVHLYGCAVDAAAMDEFCSEHGLWWIEDAAQAHGSSSDGRRAGTLGRLASWSFYPSKNLGCFGDGGAVTSGDVELLERVHLLANHGQTARYRHSMVGTNSRLDALQAAVLNLRLARLDDDNRARAAVVARYREELADVGDLVLPTDSRGAVSANHLFTVRSGRRDELQQFLGDRGIGSAVHYPCALSEQAGVEFEGDPLRLTPEACRAGLEVLSLPLFPEIETDEVSSVIAAVRDFFG